MNNNMLNQISSAAVPQQPAMNSTYSGSANSQGIFGASAGNTTDYMDAARQVTIRDIGIIDNFMKAGIINPVQGQHLMNYVLNKAQEYVVKQQQAAAQNPSKSQIVSGVEDFVKENPDFFNQNGRTQVLDYLKNSNMVVDKDEIAKISQMIEALEKSAVEGYLQQQAHAKSLNDENEAAKQKLRANAQNSNTADANARVFTREQIGKMSGAEFAKNERAIMEQLRKGLIR